MHLLYRLFGRSTTREYRISAERIRQLEAKALEQMKDVLDRRSLRGSTSALQGRSNAARGPGWPGAASLPGVVAA